jgi:hypothetical protein
MSQIQRLNALLVQSNANVAAAMMADRFGAAPTPVLQWQLFLRPFMAASNDPFTVSVMGSTSRTMVQRAR